MPTNDVKIIKNPGPVLSFIVDDWTTSTYVATIKPGEPVKQVATTGAYATILLTGDPEIGTDIMIGIVAQESTETSAADGTVDVTTIIPGSMLRAKAATSTNINTAAKLLALRYISVCFDGPAAVTTSPRTAYTIDEDEGVDDNVHGLKIIDGDIAAGTLDVVVNVMATIYGYYV